MSWQTLAFTSALALSAALSEAQEQANCYIEPLDPVWSEGASVLNELRNDPLSEGLRTFSDEIVGLMTAQQQLLRDAQAAVMRPDCADASAMSAHNAKVAVVVSKMRSAVDRAKDILSPAHTEEAFWLMAERYSRRDCDRVGPNDCEAMARLYAALGRKTTWDLDAMIRIAGQVLSDGIRLVVRGHTVQTIVDVGPRKLLPFCQGGFRQAYLDQDNDSRNQVRHFTAYLGLGNYLMGNSAVSSSLTEALAEYREAGDDPDYQLGVVAANLGRRLRDNPSLVRGLDGAIRSTVCR
jgi:hypothetical protein